MVDDVEAVEVPSISIRRPRPRIQPVEIDKLDIMLKERPYAVSLIQMQLLNDIAGILDDTYDRIGRLERMVTESIPQGKLKALDYTVTDEITRIRRKDEKSLPWISFTLYNDGPDSVFVQINEDILGKAAAIAEGESLEVDFKSPKVQQLILKCAKGNSCSIRIYAMK